MSAEEKRTLERTLLEKAKELMSIAGDAIPPHGYLEMAVFHDLIIASINYNWREKTVAERRMLTCWADPREERMEIYSE